MDLRSLSEVESWLHRELKKKALGLASLQRTIARQKSWIAWLREGKANMQFFQIYASHCRRRNHIFRLKNGSEEATSRDSMCAIVGEYFAGMLGLPTLWEHSICLDALQLMRIDAAVLESPLSEELIWNTIKGIRPDKASGPDGFSMRFYQACWPTIKEVVMKAVRAFDLADVQGLERLNEAFIALLPKVDGAVDIKDFRPICLIHSFAKILAKAVFGAHTGDSLSRGHEPKHVRGRPIYFVQFYACPTIYPHTAPSQGAGHPLQDRHCEGLRFGLLAVSL